MNFIKKTKPHAFLLALHDHTDYPYFKMKKAQVKKQYLLYLMLTS